MLPSPGAQSIIYTASLTVRVASLGRAAAAAAQLARSDGGYLASERTALRPGPPGPVHGQPAAESPAASYQQALAILSAQLGTRLTLHQQAPDVTQRVANVNSLVTSEEDAIAALQGLLKRAGVESAGLLQVQQQISLDESTLNSLLAQQRALDHETNCDRGP